MKVRILTEHRLGDALLRCNAVPDLEEKLAKSLVAQGVADDDKAAVAYAQNEGVEVPDLPAEFAPAKKQPAS